MGVLKGPITARTLPGVLPVHDGYAPEIKELYNGNKAYVANVLETNPGLFQSLADNGQSTFYSFLYFKILSI